MQTVAVPETTRKPGKAFYAHLDSDHGVLTMDDAGVMWFRNSETDALTTITPAHVNFLSVHGEVGLCDTQLIRDGDRVKKCSQTLVGV